MWAVIIVHTVYFSIHKVQLDFIYLNGSLLITLSTKDLVKVAANLNPTQTLLTVM